MPVSSKSLSASVDFPWSTWAIIEKFLILSGGYCVKSTFALSLLSCWREFEENEQAESNKQWWFWHWLNLEIIGLVLGIEESI